MSHEEQCGTRAVIAPLLTVAETYEGWWPLSVETLCRALVTIEHPLRSTPMRELLAHFDAITPEQSAQVRATAQNALRDRLIPSKAVDLSYPDRRGQR